MPAFTTARRRRKRRSDTTRLVAIDFGVHERTLRRWIARPELRPALRAYRHGKQWRLDVPKTDLAFARYKRDVFRAVRPFKRKRREIVSSWAKKVACTLGYDGNRRRERDLRILRAAAQLKLARAKPTSVFKAKSRLAERTQSDRSAAYIFETQILAAKYRCDVFDVLAHFGREKQTRKNNNLYRRIQQWWPTREQFEKASEDFQSFWRTRTLTEAAYELTKDNKGIVGKNLAPLLFLNHDRESAWKANEKKQKALRERTGNSVMLDPYGKRGISLRLFRQRYKRKDIAAARKLAEGMTRSESEKKLDEDGKDESGFSSRTKAMWPNDSKDTQVDNDALWVKDGGEPNVISPSVRQAIRDCQQAIREARNDAERKALQDYLRKLKAEENFPPVI
jgi:hypothetical protein